MSPATPNLFPHLPAGIAQQEDYHRLQAWTTVPHCHTIVLHELACITPSPSVLDDPQRCRHRPSNPASWADLARVPRCPGEGNPGRGTASASIPCSCASCPCCSSWSTVPAHAPGRYHCSSHRCGDHPAGPEPVDPPASTDKEDHAQAAAEARGQAAMPALIRRNSTCRDQAGNDLPQFVSGSRLRGRTVGSAGLIRTIGIPPNMKRILNPLDAT